MFISIKNSVKMIPSLTFLMCLSVSADDCITNFIEEREDEGEIQTTIYIENNCPVAVRWTMCVLNTVTGERRYPIGQSSPGNFFSHKLPKGTREQDLSVWFESCSEPGCRADPIECE